VVDFCKSGVVIIVLLLKSYLTNSPNLSQKVLRVGGGQASCRIVTDAVYDVITLKTSYPGHCTTSSQSVNQSLCHYLFPVS
jgi:hypothetical protein